MKRQDGFNPDSNKIPITELTQSEAVAYGDMMKQAFIEHWEKKAASPQPPKPPKDRVYTNSWKTDPPPNHNK